MGCDVFRVTGLTGDCLAEPACRDNCAIFDPTGKTSKSEVLMILQNDNWGKEQLAKFYVRLAKRYDLTAVQLMLARAAAAAEAEV